MEQTEMTMGKRIAARRKELKMTQERLAQELGVSPQAVSKWENDLSCPDISILPKLAKLLGITTDALLGAEPAEVVHEAEIVPEEKPDDDRPGIYVESSGDHKFDIHFGSPKRASFTGAAWLICLGGLMLAGPLFGLESMGFWSALWISGLFVWGVSGMIRRVRFSNAVAALGGVYFALEGLGLIDLDLGWELVFPSLILLLGVSLLLDEFRKKRNHSSGSFHVITSQPGMASQVVLEDGVLGYDNSFGEDHYQVVTPLLKSGRINVSFGDHELDFSGVEAVAEGCTVEVNASFGDLRLRIPRRFRANFVTSKNFADVQTMGQHDPFPEGTINLVGNLSFGDMTIEYI